MRHRPCFAKAEMASCRCRLFATFALLMIGFVADSASVVVGTLTTTTQTNEKPTPQSKTVKAKATLTAAPSPTSATAALALPTLTSLLSPAVSSYSAETNKVTRAALASAVSAMTNERQEGAATAATVGATVSHTRATSSLPAEAPAISVAAASAEEPSSITPVQVTPQTLATDSRASQAAEMLSTPSSKSKPSPPAPPLTLLKDGENCSSSSQCKDGCCRHTDGSLADVFGHDGNQAQDVIVPMHGVCSKKLGEASEYCGSGCKCKGGLSCYKPRIGVCCQPELCYEKSFVNHQEAYLKRCQSRRGCVMPQQFDD